MRGQPRVTGQDGTPPSIYRLNARDEIIFVNDGWVRFADSAGAGHLRRERVLGQPLWRFLSEPRMVELYRLVLDHVRRDRAEITLPFRADSAEHHREVEVRVGWWGDGHVLFKCRVVRESYRERFVTFLAPDAPWIDRRGDPLPLCGWCNLVQTPAGWIDVESAAGSHPAGAVPAIVHRVCERCDAAVRDRVRARRVPISPLDSDGDRPRGRRGRRHGRRVRAA